MMSMLVAAMLLVVSSCTCVCFTFSYVIMVIVCILQSTTLNSFFFCSSHFKPVISTSSAMLCSDPSSFNRFHNFLFLYYCRRCPRRWCWFRCTNCQQRHWWLSTDRDTNWNCCWFQGILQELLISIVNLRITISYHSKWPYLTFLRWISK
jgi:hypothetical protein